ncbi:MAG: fluoride efflux transporter CrcB [Alteraurantiacibacter sp.]
MSSGTPQLYASLSVALGGGIGALARYQLGRAMTAWLGPNIVTSFPFPTLAANAIGSLLMGLLAGWLALRGDGFGMQGDQLRLLLGVGLLGGFTTFSAFSLEMVLLMQRGQYGLAAIYVVLSLGLCLSGLMIGLMMTRAFS